MEKLDKKAILFVMTDDTRNCDDVAAYLEGRYPDLKDAVLVIHTKKNGEISESSTGKDKHAPDHSHKGKCIDPSVRMQMVDSADCPDRCILDDPMCRCMERTVAR